MSMNNFGTGMIAGIVIGSVVNMAMNSNPKKVAVAKKKVGRTLKTLGNMVDHFS